MSSQSNDESPPPTERIEITFASLLTLKYLQHAWEINRNTMVFLTRNEAMATLNSIRQ